jgi:hypothetical protein
MPETFRWNYYIFDVSKINHDVANGNLLGVGVTIRRDTIKWFCRNVLGIADSGRRLFPQMPPIDEAYAKALSPTRLKDPVIFAQIDDVRCALSYDPFSSQILIPPSPEIASTVVVDGNHRLASACFNDMVSCSGFFLSSRQVAKYLLDAR